MTTNAPGPGQQLLDTGVVAIVRGGSGERTAVVLDALVDAGVTCLEVTMNTPGALADIAAARARFGAAAEVGAGTVRTVEHAQAAFDARAQFLVSPHVGVDVARWAVQQRLAYYPGAFTATEVMTAWQTGAAAVKLFPANAGGPRYLRDLRAPLDDIPLVPTGGISATEAGEYVAAGAVAVGAGGQLIGDALKPDGDLDALRERCRAFLEAVRSARAAR